MHLIIPLLVLGLAEYLPYSLLLKLVQRKMVPNSTKMEVKNRIPSYPKKPVGKADARSPLLF